MNKIIITLMAIYFLGDPDLQYLSWLGDLKIYAVAVALSLVSMPWITSQIDGRRVYRRTEGTSPVTSAAFPGMPNGQISLYRRT